MSDAREAIHKLLIETAKALTDEGMPRSELTQAVEMAMLIWPSEVAD